ncbi:MAG TPA: AI-2E family transporter [Candidatus Limnocylindrales bacterium]|jgi:predicted PurR-regulated permease PerM
MSEQPMTPLSELTPREHRWLTALLILGTVAVAFVVLSFVTGLLAYFSDVIMIFFLAWLLAFILSPLASALVHLIPRLPRALAVILVYSLLIVGLIVAILLVAQQLYASINNLVSNWPSDQRLREILQPWQNRLNSVGGSQISLYDQVNQLLASLKNGAGELAKPLGDVAVASLGVFGNLLFVFFLSLYMAVDRDRIVSFLFRIVPPAYNDEARLLEHSVARSFGGFLRGQALSGLIYGLVSMVASQLLGLPYMPVTATSSGILQAIPFFGPFISWIPPVLVAIFFKPDAVLPVLIIMVAGWFVLMNIIQPRLMAEAVGLHPVVVLGSVMVGTKIAGIPGAIFGIPIAAVIGSFFFYYLGRNRDTESVALRAARKVEEREGHPVRVPRLPQAGEDEEVEGAVATEGQPNLERRRRTPRPATAADDAGVRPVDQARHVAGTAPAPLAAPDGGASRGE